MLFSGDGHHQSVGICISATLGKLLRDCTFHACSNRVCTLNFILSGKKFCVFSCYFPTTWHDDEDVEEMYHALDTLLLACGESGTIPILGGDFNACIGMANKETDEFVQHIGPHGMGTRNVRGTLLARWICQQGLYIFNRYKSVDQHEWQPEWVCLRCNTAVTPNDLTIDTDEPPPICPFHGPRRLAIDVRHNERGWVCSRGLPPHILQCEPTRINTPAPPSTPAAPGQRQWEHQRPPSDGQAIPDANSWFYVPLLLAGANQLHPDAADAWRAHRHAGPEWQDLVTQLRRAPAMPWQRLHHTLQMLQQIALDTGHRLPAAETALVEQLGIAGSREPTGAQIHFPWAMNLFTQSSGYVPATAQEALLQNFLGERQASQAASMAERWRQQTRPATEARPAHIRRYEATPSHRQPPPPATEARPAHTSRPPSPPTDSSPSTTSSTSSSTDTTSSSTPTARAPTPPAPPQPPPAPETTSPDERRLHVALATLDDIDLFATLQQKCLFFQTPPQFIRGRVRQAFSYALHNINTAPSQGMPGSVGTVRQIRSVPGRVFPQRRAVAGCIRSFGNFRPRLIQPQKANNAWKILVLGAGSRKDVLP